MPHLIASMMRSILPDTRLTEGQRELSSLLNTNYPLYETSKAPTLGSCSKYSLSCSSLCTRLKYISYSTYSLGTWLNNTTASGLCVMTDAFTTRYVTYFTRRMSGTWPHHASCSSCVGHSSGSTQRQCTSCHRRSGPLTLFSDNKFAPFQSTGVLGFWGFGVLGF